MCYGTCFWERVKERQKGKFQVYSTPLPQHVTFHDLIFGWSWLLAKKASVLLKFIVCWKCLNSDLLQVMSFRNCSFNFYILYSNYECFGLASDRDRIKNYKCVWKVHMCCLPICLLTLSLIRNSAADDFKHILSKIENLYNWMDNLWLKVENIVAKGEIARFEQFLLLSLCFQKAVCCRGVRKRLYERKS